MSTTINVICYKSKVLSNNEHPLRLRVCKDRKVKHFNLGISVPFAFWDFDKQKPKKNCPNRELLEKVNNLVSVKTVKELFDLYITRLNLLSKKYHFG